MCCCESSSGSSCHSGSSNSYDSAGPWADMASLSDPSPTSSGAYNPSSCLGGDALQSCAYDCRFSYTISVSGSTLTLTSSYEGVQSTCTCPSGSGTIDTFSHTATGSFSDGTVFVATPDYLNPECPTGCDSARIVFTSANPTTVCDFTYDVTKRNMDAAAAVAGVVWLLMVCAGFMIPMAGIFCCIKSKAQMGAQPSPMAWIGCLLIFCFTGPCFMWIPFVLDSCYQNANVNNNQFGNVVITTQQHGQAQPSYGQPQPGYGQQPIMATAVAMPQPAMAQATAVAMPTATATATGAPPGYGAPVATVTAA